MPRWLWLVLLVAAGWYFSPGHQVRHAAGVLAAAVPLQEPLDRTATLRSGDPQILPLAKFSLSARVLARADYHWDSLAALVPIDLALGWGRMSDSAVLEKVDISQSGRFYFWRVAQFPIPEREIIESSANMHLIAADRTVAREIARTRVGDLVSLDGYLVEIDWANGAKAVSSLTRSDSGAGACEIVWVESFTIAPR